ncbi:DUF6578 domain-containing protein [Streptomyces kanamyceticus]|uniref:DUF6578 domain-containing protein n=1 Tax=Streptomyces kanamyceticus TaxID=1967 RepID=UPI0037DCEE14
MALWKVMYEDWQMECCGEPFAVGDEVAWPLRVDGDRLHDAAWAADRSEVEGPVVRLDALEGDWAEDDGDFGGDGVFGGGGDFEGGGFENDGGFGGGGVFGGGGGFEGGGCFGGPDSQDSDSQGADGEDADGEGAVGQGADGEDADGEDAVGQGADGEDADGEGADSQGADGEGAEGQGAEGQGADREDADGEDADSQGADDEDADDEDADGEDVGGEGGFEESWEPAVVRAHGITVPWNRPAPSPSEPVRLTGLLTVERHGGRWPDTIGRVRAIHIVTQGFAETAEGSRTYRPVPGERWLRPVESCPKWFQAEERSRTTQGPGYRREETGVLVELEVREA